MPNFDHMSRWVADKTGSPGVFFAACIGIVVWMVSGPFLHFSDSWMLLINTGTTIITYLMVFLIQGSQNTDTRAIHAKLDELILTLTDTDEDFMDAEHMDRKDLEALILRRFGSKEKG